MLGLLPKVVINNETTTDHLKFSCPISVAESMWLHMEQQSTKLGDLMLTLRPASPLQCFCSVFLSQIQQQEEKSVEVAPFTTGWNVGTCFPPDLSWLQDSASVKNLQTIRETFLIPLLLTTNKINNVLCNNFNCSAAAKNLSLTHLYPTHTSSANRCLQHHFNKSSHRYIWIWGT